MTIEQGFCQVCGRPNCTRHPQPKGPVMVNFEPERMEPRYRIYDTTDPHWVMKADLDNIITNLRAKPPTPENQEALEFYVERRASYD